MVIKVNDVEIANHNYYPHLSKFLILSRVTPERRHLMEQTGEFYGTDSNELTVGSLVDENDKAKEVQTVWSFDSKSFPSLKDRSGAFSEKKFKVRKGVVVVSTYILTDVCNGSTPLVFPPCDISIDLFPNEASKAILTTHPNPEQLRVEIQSAYLTVPRILPKPNVIAKSLKWDFLRIKISPLIVAAGSTEFHSVILHSGTLGRRISLMIIDNDNWEGGYRHSIYRSTHHDVESIHFQIGSKVIPTQRIKADFATADYAEMYMFCLESLRFSLEKSGGGELINKSAWAEGGDFVFVADTSVDQTADAGFQGKKESGSINLAVTFSKPLPENAVILIFTETTAEMSMNASGGVSVTE